MKTILVPIDLASSAEHTLAYANKLAVRWPAEVVLLHCHHGDGLNAEESAQLEQQLHALAERLRYQQLTRQDGRRIRYHYRVLSGCLHDHVQVEAARCAADLVVMSLDYIDCGRVEAAGNHAATITGLVACPVLVVPLGRRSLPTRVAFSAGFSTLDLNVLPKTSVLEGAFPAQLQLVQFYAPSNRSERARLKRALEKAATQLTWPDISTHLVEDDDPLEGISDFCARTQTQLLIIAPTNSATLLRFFDVCYAKTRSYHTQIPVLVIQQNEQKLTTACCARCAQQALREAQAALVLGAHI